MPRKHIKIISLLLSMWILFTSIGMSIDVHFCNSAVYSIGINAPADKCDGYALSHERHEGENLAKETCCDHISLYFHHNSEGLNNETAFQSQDQFKTAVLVQAVAIYGQSIGPNRLNHHYTPPDLPQDVLSLFSVLRI